MNKFTYRVMFFLFISGIPLFAQTTPTFKEGVIYLTRFISSGYFKSIKTGDNDISLVDTIFLRSAKYYNNDYSEALLALTFACLPYNEMHLKIPVISSVLTIPLPSVKSSLFSRKNENLPSRLFYDTPPGSFGDKDKLSHFFGNAFIEYNFPFFNLSKFLGIFVEKFEETFYVEGAMDKRDLYVNRLGAKFGKALKKSGSLLPSEFLNKHTEKK